MSDDSIHQLAQQYGPFASFTHTDIGPIAYDYHGDSPVEEMQRLLERYAQAGSQILDIGCGAGQTLCSLAGRVRHIWGIDRNQELLTLARQSLVDNAISNATLLSGDVVTDDIIEQIADDSIDMAFSQRGPNMNRQLVRKLRPEGIFIQELVSSANSYPLQEIFGRKSYSPYTYGEQQVLLSQYAELALLPISSKEYMYESYYRDRDHLEMLLQSHNGTALISDWRWGDRPYLPEHDRKALDLYVQYNTTSKGIRLLGQRRIFVLRKRSEPFYPIDSDRHNSRTSN